MSRRSSQVETLDNWNQNTTEIKSLQACKTRAILSKEQAIEIFLIKLENNRDSRCRISSRRSAASVARQYGVSDKAVRDIWMGRTWFRELMHLDPARAMMPERLKLPGRPSGKRTQKVSTVTTGTSAPHYLSDSLHVFSERCQDLLEPDVGMISNFLWAPCQFSIEQGPPPVSSSMPTFSPHPPGPVVSSSPCGRVTSSHFELDDATSSATAPVAAALPRFIRNASTTVSIWPRLNHPESSIQVTAHPAIDPLPEASRADDPFHDDWRYWPEADKKCFA